MSRPFLIRARRAAVALTGLVAAVLLMTPSGARAYFEESDVGVRSLGFGRAFAGVADDASTIYWNPAGLALLSKPELLLVHSRPYAVDGLASNYAATAFPWSRLAVGASWHHFGAADIMNEDTFTLAAAREFHAGWTGARLALGGAAKIGRVAFVPYADPVTLEEVDAGSATKFTADLGALVRFPNRMSLGAAWRNIGSPEFDVIDGGGGGEWPSTLQIGGAYQWNPESTISVDWQQIDRNNSTLNIGGELWFYRAFALRMGITSDAGASAGISVKARRWTLDMVALTNRPLGASYRVGLKLPFNLGGGAR